MEKDYIKDYIDVASVNTDLGVLHPRPVGPDANDISSMKNILNKLYGTEINESVSNNTNSNQYLMETKHPTSVDSPSYHPDPNVADMKNLLNKLYGTAQNLKEDAKIDKVLRESLVTKKENDTVIFDNRFEIKIKMLEGKDKQVYDVYDRKFDEIVAENLYLYEAAHGIVKYLNKGMSPLSTDIRKLIGLEETYLQNRVEAIFFKRKLREELSVRNSNKVVIYENKYDFARNSMIEVKKKIKNIIEKI